MNADDKLFDEEQALLLLTSLSKSFKALVQTLLMGRSTLNLDEKIAALRENERMMRIENFDNEHHAIAVVEFDWGRNHSRRHDGSRGRSKSQSCAQWDMSNVQCYYCGENGHIQVRCKEMKEDLKKLRDMNKDDINSKANVLKGVEDEDDVFLEINDEVAKTKWVMDYAASKHIYRDRKMFDTLKTDEKFDHFKLGNDGKMKVESIRSVRMKFHDNTIWTFSNVRFVPSTVIFELSQM